MKKGKLKKKRSKLQKAMINLNKQVITQESKHSTTSFKRRFERCSNVWWDIYKYINLSRA